MAKVVGPLHSSEARGRMGGLVYNSWRGSATVKAKHAPAQPRSSLQLAVRATAIYCSRAWQALAATAQWNAYAAAHPLVDWTGSTKRLTGANWFVMLTTRLIRAGVAPVLTPPVANAPDAVTILAVSGGSGTLTMTWTDPGSVDDHIEFWLDGPRTAGRQGSLTKAKYNGFALGNAANFVISGLLDGHYTVYARSISWVDGQVSVWVSLAGTVT